MFVVGLTGGIASGKSTVSEMLRDMGIEVVDADLVARQVVAIGQPAYKKIVAAFGDGVLLDNGELDRPALAEIVFKDKSKRMLLNKCTHPHIHRHMFYTILGYFIRGHQFIVMDLPLLYETKAFVGLFHKVVVVNCTGEQQLERLMARNSLTQERAMARINAQLSLREKCQRADVVIDNENDFIQTRQEVTIMVDSLRKSNQHIVNRVIVLLPIVALAVGLRWLLS